MKRKIISAILAFSMLFGIITQAVALADEYSVSSFAGNTLYVGQDEVFLFDESFLPTDVYVNSEVISTEKYIIAEGKILIDGSCFTVADEYNIRLVMGENSAECDINITEPELESFYLKPEHENAIVSENVTVQPDMSNATTVYSNFNLSSAKFSSIQSKAALIYDYYGKSYFRYHVLQNGKYDVYYSLYGIAETNPYCNDVKIITVGNETETECIVSKKQLAENQWTNIAKNLEFSGKTDGSEYIQISRGTETASLYAVAIIKLTESIDNSAVENEFGPEQRDKVPPTFKTDGLSEEWTKEDYSFSITAEDDVAGVKSFSVNGNDIPETDGRFVYTGSTGESSDGIFTVCATDNNNNISEDRIDTRVDKTVPTATFETEAAAGKIIFKNINQVSGRAGIKSMTANVYSDSDCTNLVASTLINGNSVELNGLEYLTEYYCTVGVLSNAGVHGMSGVESVTTLDMQLGVLVSFAGNVLKPEVSQVFVFNNAFVPVSAYVNNNGVTFTEKSGKVLIGGENFPNIGNYTVRLTDAENNSIETDISLEERDVIYLYSDDGEGNVLSDNTVEKSSTFSGAVSSFAYTIFKRKIAWASDSAKENNVYWKWINLDEGEYSFEYATPETEKMNSWIIEVSDKNGTDNTYITNNAKAELLPLGDGKRYSFDSDSYIKVMSDFDKPLAGLKRIGVGIVKAVKYTYDNNAALSYFYSNEILSYNINLNTENEYYINSDIAFDVTDAPNMAVYLNKKKIDFTYDNNVLTISSGEFAVKGNYDVKIIPDASTGIYKEFNIYIDEKEKQMLTPSVINTKNMYSNALFIFQPCNKFDKKQKFIKIDDEIHKDGFELKNGRLMIDGDYFNTEKKYEITLVIGSDMYSCEYEIGNKNIIYTTKDTNYIEGGAFIDATTHKGPDENRKVRVVNNPGSKIYVTWNVKDAGSYYIDVWLLRSYMDVVYPINVEVCDENGIHTFKSLHYKNLGYDSTTSDSNIYHPLMQDGKNYMFTFTGNGTEYIKITPDVDTDMRFSGTPRIGADSLRMYVAEAAVNTAYGLSNENTYVKSMNVVTDTYNVTAEFEFNENIDSETLNNNVKLSKKGEAVEFTITKLSDSRYKIVTDNERDYTNSYKLTLEKSISGSTPLNVDYNLEITPESPFTASSIVKSGDSYTVSLANYGAPQNYAAFISVYDANGAMKMTKLFKGTLTENTDITAVFDGVSEKDTVECVVYNNLEVLKQLYNTVR